MCWSKSKLDKALLANEKQCRHVFNAFMSIKRCCNMFIASQDNNTGFFNAAI